MVVEYVISGLSAGVYVAVIRVLPAPFGVTIPSAETDATSEFATVHCASLELP